MPRSERSARPRPLLLALSLATVAGPAVVPAEADFVDRSVPAGVGLGDFTYGAAWSDLDLDGDLDLFTGRHFPSPAVYSNRGDGTFETAPELFEPGDHHGAVIADFDDDGDPDIYITAGAGGGSGAVPKSFYRNDGDLSFTDIADAAGLRDSLGRGRSCSAMDVNRDGALDLFVAKAKKPGQPNSLFLNDGSGSFTDVAADAGIADWFGSIGGIWGDFDRDGDPDLFVGGEESTIDESRLYRNDGDLVFADVTGQMLPGLGRVAAAAWGDYDKDGDLDLAIGLGDEALFDSVDSDFGTLHFFLNARDDEDGIDGIDFSAPSSNSITFDLLTSGVWNPETVFIGSAGFHPGPATPFTLTRAAADGQPSFDPGVDVGLYIWTEGHHWKIRGSTPAGIGTNFSGVLEAPGNVNSLATSNLEPYTPGPRGTRLYRNDGEVFTDVTSAMHVSDAVNVRVLTWVDYDGDGDLDLHVLAKGDTEVQNEPDVLWENDVTRFTDVTSLQQAEGPGFGLGEACAFDDYDGDGDPDLAILSGAPPRILALQETDRLYANVSDVPNWLRIDLVGTVSNRDGIGAWVTCVGTETGTQTHYVTANAWRGSQVMLDPWFGLHDDSGATLVRVEWPSGIVTEHTDVPAGELRIFETLTSVDAPSVAGPGPVGLSARPLPSRGPVELVIEGRLGRGGVLEIFDTAGRRLARRDVGPDARRHSWDGRDLSGRPVAAGVYYGVLRTGGEVFRTKLVLVR